MKQENLILFVGISLFLVFALVMFLNFETGIKAPNTNEKLYWYLTYSTIAYLLIFAVFLIVTMFMHSNLDSEHLKGGTTVSGPKAFKTRYSQNVIGSIFSSSTWSHYPIKAMVDLTYLMIWPAVALSIQWIIVTLIFKYNLKKRNKF